MLHQDLVKWTEPCSFAEVWDSASIFFIVNCGFWQPLNDEVTDLNVAAEVFWKKVQYIVVVKLEARKTDTEKLQKKSNICEKNVIHWKQIQSNN